MIETPVSGWILFFALLLLSSYSGTALARCLPWTTAARDARLPLWIGLALGPFLVGSAAVFALGILPTMSHTVHIAAVFVFTGLFGAIAALANRQRPAIGRTTTARTLGERLFVGVTLVWIAVLVGNAVFLPLFQNDPLEYATVGRLLFEKRSLAFYPAIDPEVGASGFYGPWTHPPLYVSLVYLSNILQGHADAPGLMRLIAPWFAIAGAGVVYGLGCISGRLTGACAAMLFISTPLFILGADSALIDPLPVLGFATVIAAIVGVGGGAIVRGVASGAALGLALWTHSQAILFPPLALAAIAFRHGLSGWRRAIGEGAVMVLVAAILAAWPYLRNIAIFGSPISDNPDVFAAPSLGWDDYFRFARGLDNWSAVVQYGVLKGWFALEAFGWSFWLMAFGAAVVLLRIKFKGVLSALVRPADTFSSPMLMLIICVGLIVTYTVGVSLSVLVGTELVRNERYLMIMLPPAAVVGGYGMASVLEWLSSPSLNERFVAVKNACFAVAASGLAAVILVQVYLVGWHYRWVNPWPQQAGANPAIALALTDPGRFSALLALRPNTRAAQLVSDRLPDRAVILSMMPADMYYSGRRMVSYLDPRMLAAYRKSNPSEMAEELRDLGITHILIPSYYLPPVNNSALQQVVASPELTRLEFAVGGAQLYALEGEDLAVEARWPIEPGVRPWTRYPRLTIGGRKALAGIALQPEILTENGTSEPEGVLDLFHRDFSTVLSLGIGTDACALHCEKDIGSLPSVEENRQYRLTIDLSGRGFVKIRILQYGDDGPITPQAPDGWVTSLGDFALVSEHGTQQFTRRFQTLPGARRLGVQVEHVGHSAIKIEQATIEKFGSKAVRNARIEP